MSTTSAPVAPATLIHTRPSVVNRRPGTVGVDPMEFIADNVPTERVSCDYTYARPLTQKRIASLNKKQWDPRRAGVLYMSMRDDGTYYTIDGQGRMFLAIKFKIPTVPARVYIDLTVQDEAELYLAFNRDRVATEPIDDFMARLVMNEPSAIAIQSIVTALGLTIAKGSGANKVHCVAMLDKVYALWGPQVLESSLRLLLDAWASQTGSLVSAMVGGAMQFVVRYPKLSLIQYRDLVARMGKVMPAHVAARARGVQQESPGMGLDSAYGRVLWSIYNTGRRTHRLDDWQARVYSPDAMAAKPDIARKAVATRNAAANANKGAKQNATD